MKKLMIILFFSCFLMLAACQSQPEVVNTPEIIEQTRIVVVTATPEPTTEIVPTAESVILGQEGEEIRIYPNLWTEISSDKMTVFPSNRIWEYTFDEGGNLWAAGDFGIAYYELDGTVTQYTMGNGLPINAFHTVAIAPDGQVWAGGYDNMLVRFNGSEWVDEGKNLPEPYDPRQGLLCEENAIVDIEFDDDGGVWILNGLYEIYTQVDGQWINLWFPKNLAPMAGGGGCVVGLRVIAEDNIFLGRTGCCSNPPTGYHYDGAQWELADDYYLIEEKFESRHNQYAQMSASELLGIENLTTPDLLDIDYPPAELEELGECADSVFNGEPVCQFTNLTNENFPEGWFYQNNHLYYRVKDISEDYQILESIDPIEMLEEDAVGNIVFANATNVYFMREETYQSYILLEQDVKPCVMLEENLNAEFHPRYTDYFCGFNDIYADHIHTVHHTAKLLHFMEDGSLLFATDHLLAQWKDEEWRSFYFDTVTFDSVTVDDEGYIWVYAGVNGFLRFSPDIFDDYVNYWAEERN